MSVAIDKRLGAERRTTGETKRGVTGENLNDIVRGAEVRDGGGMGAYGVGAKQRPVDIAVTLPGCPESEPWHRWVTNLGPGHEPIVLFRKPFKGTCATNLLAHGTGALNRPECSIPGAKPATTRGAGGQHGRYSQRGAQGRIEDDGNGRWPKNVLFDEAAAAMLDEQSGITRSGTMRANQKRGRGRTVYKGPEPTTTSGGASRFFYCAKASKADRERGLEDMPVRTGGALTGRKAGSKGLENPCSGAHWQGEGRRNIHPTVKPTELMQWLVRLVTQPGQLVLDPFAGSGSTGVACALEGREHVGVELSAEYCEIARRRIASVP
jgi:site-specific DNA-methyltransferase (adenine-specific)